MGVEPTKNVLRPSLVLKTSRVTGHDSLPCLVFRYFLYILLIKQSPLLSLWGKYGAKEMAKGYSTEKTASGWVLRIKYKGIRSSQKFNTKHAADVEGRKRTNLIDLGEYSKNTTVSRMSFLDRLKQFIVEAKPSIQSPSD